MDDLTAFLAARLDEDEAALGYVEPGPWTSSGPYVGSASGIIAQARHTETGAHIARHDPARVLREVEAKRAMLALHNAFSNPASLVERALWPSIREALLCILRDAAAVYSDHPDYRQEWAPDRALPHHGGPREALPRPPAHRAQVGSRGPLAAHRHHASQVLAS